VSTNPFGNQKAEEPSVLKPAVKRVSATPSPFGQVKKPKKPAPLK
jgi:hypothetical protein